MTQYPLYLPGDVEITSIIRTLAPVNTCFEYNANSPIPVDVTLGSCNMYVVSGLNLDKIIEVEWYPVKQSNILFRMSPWRAYGSPANEAMFGIIVLEQDLSNIHTTGNISFRIASGHAISIPSATFSTYPWGINPIINPLQGKDDGGPTGGGGAY